MALTLMPQRFVRLWSGGGSPGTVDGWVQRQVTAVWHGPAVASQICMELSQHKLDAVVLDYCLQ